jgi:hypothetical protein
MFRAIRIAALAATALCGVAALALATPSAPGAKVYFIDVKNGDTVKRPFVIHFGLSGMGVSPAGVENQPNTGHHHLLIDDKLEGDALKNALPNDEHHMHFGKGQTEATLSLPPGSHTLQLVFADWQHVPHEAPVISDRVTITVQ